MPRQQTPIPEGWFAVYTLPRGEELARQQLARQGFDVYLPRYRKRRRHARRIDIVLAPLFPRYLFVRLAPDVRPWHAVNGTRGVKNLVSFGDRPARLPDGVIEELRAREDEDGYVRLDDASPFRMGQKVEIISGPLRDQVAVFFAAHDDERRVMLLLDVLGRQTRVTVRADAVAACA